uniref:Methyltransferase domain-containing protein n=1 Tax=Pyrodinium bahamense TaxID=73915 RepID=A0A7S0F914_9DINO
MAAALSVGSRRLAPRAVVPVAGSLGRGRLANSGTVARCDGGLRCARPVAVPSCQVASCGLPPLVRGRSSGPAVAQEEPALLGPESGSSGTWSRFVQWSYRTFGRWLFPQRADICNCGADFGAPIPQSELVIREGMQHGSKEWRMQLFGAALYWHVATLPGEKMIEANPEMFRGADVLEVACMRGGGARYLTEMMGPRRYLATDSVQEHVDECRQLHKDVPGLEFERLDAMELAERLPKECFDYVICIQAASSFSDLQRFVHGVGHVLRPGGRLLLCDGLTRPKLEIILETMHQTGLEQDACSDMSRAVHAVGLCRIPPSLSYLRLVARKAAASVPDATST